MQILKSFIPLSFLMLLSHLSISQTNEKQFLETVILKSCENPPFCHGVSSGDPRSDRVIIWTRVTTPDTTSLMVNWYLSEDSSLTNVLQSGTFETSDNRDYTVKVDVKNLRPNTIYYYYFEHKGVTSIIGRTKTLPTRRVKNFNIGVVSCSCFQCGFFNAYEELAKHSELDLIVHLGDFIYEFKPKRYGGNRKINRIEYPYHRLVNLEDYRTRYSWYKFDHDSRRMHQLFPIIVTYDDHELADNAWRSGASNHNPEADGRWQVRRRAALQAWLEWMPVRESDDSLNYGSIRIGNLIELFKVDTRLYRDKQSIMAIDDSSRTMLGTEQYDWLVENVTKSSARWKVVLNQTMMAPLLNNKSEPIYDEQCDGYRHERAQMLGAFVSSKITGLVVLTGDLHSAWANDLPLSSNPDTSYVSAGVECVCTSVSAIDRGIKTHKTEDLYKSNPHIKYARTRGRGYLLVKFSKDETTCEDWKVTATTDSSDSELMHTISTTFKSNRWQTEE